ncbi:YecA family protein [Alkalicoccus luteus]|uniref:SEC-C motif-containing protein n=1 Tax=Alkalicoccus luteus TaxID=1237094 RepID=A0A969TVW9_9BACI|nr:SEC-C metal-binding domain-containing protein [Alkalicoccus luteus]NJP36774.1 hypothetical protein [Alkalicoccus luteus]
MEVKLNAEVAQQAERMDWEAVFTDSSAPASLTETLKRYTRRELDQLRKLAAVKGLSKLNKAELAEALGEHALLRIPEILMKADNHRADIFRKLATDGICEIAGVDDLHFVHIEYFQQLYFIRAVREGERFYLAVSPDVQERLQQILNENPEFQALWERNDIICGTALGCGVHYGVLTLPTYAALVQRLLPETDTDTIIQIFEEYTRWNPYDVILEEGLLVQIELTYSTFGPQELLEAQFSRPIGYAEVDPERLASYKDSAGPADDGPVQKFASLLENKLNVEQQKAWTTALITEHAFRIGRSFNEEAVFVIERLGLEEEQQIDQLMAALQTLYNDTKQWILKGYAPLNVPLPQQAKQASVSKIPRNAPCPCGSGKKYKKCCGA